MKFYRVSKRKILSHDMKKIVMVVCPLLKAHQGHLFLQYIWYLYGYCIDEPSYEEVRAVVEETDLGYSGWVVIETPCYYCRNHLPSGEPHRRPHGFQDNSGGLQDVPSDE